MQAQVYPDPAMAFSLLSLSDPGHDICLPRTSLSFRAPLGSILTTQEISFSSCGKEDLSRGSMAW